MDVHESEFCARFIEIGQSRVELVSRAKGDDRLIIQVVMYSETVWDV